MRHAWRRCSRRSVSKLLALGPVPSPGVTPVLLKCQTVLQAQGPRFSTCSTPLHRLIAALHRCHCATAVQSITMFWQAPALHARSGPNGRHHSPPVPEAIWDRAAGRSISLPKCRCTPEGELRQRGPRGDTAGPGPRGRGSAPGGGGRAAGPCGTPPPPLPPRPPTTPSCRRARPPIPSRPRSRSSPLVPCAPPGRRRTAPGFGSQKRWSG